MTPSIRVDLLYKKRKNYHNPDQNWVQETMLGVKPAVSKKLKLFFWAVVIVYVLLAIIKVHV
jgi:hypothetical protein